MYLHVCRVGYCCCCYRYAAELEAWEKLAAATSSAPSHSLAPISPIVPKESPHDELLQQLSIEVSSYYTWKTLNICMYGKCSSPFAAATEMNGFSKEHIVFCMGF